MPENFPFRREQAPHPSDVAGILSLRAHEEYDPELFAHTQAILQKEFQDAKDPTEKLQLLERRFIDCAAQALAEKESRGTGAMVSTKIHKDRSQHYQQYGFLPLQLKSEKMQHTNLFDTNNIRALFRRLELQRTYKGNLFDARQQVNHNVFPTTYTEFEAAVTFAKKILEERSRLREAEHKPYNWDSDGQLTAKSLGEAADLKKIQNFFNLYAGRETGNSYQRHARDISSSLAHTREQLKFNNTIEAGTKTIAFQYGPSRVHFVTEQSYLRLNTFGEQDVVGVLPVDSDTVAIAQKGNQVFVARFPRDSRLYSLADMLGEIAPVHDKEAHVTFVVPAPVEHITPDHLPRHTTVSEDTAYLQQNFESTHIMYYPQKHPSSVTDYAVVVTRDSVKIAGFKERRDTTSGVSVELVSDR